MSRIDAIRWLARSWQICFCKAPAAQWVNDKRVEHLWRREGLKVPTKQPKKGRLWLNDGSCVRLRPGYPHHVCFSGM